MFLLEFLQGAFIYVVPFLFLIIVLVTVHEFGHFYAAFIIGVKATHFAVGMGPVLWSKTDKNGCAWQLRAFPIGGYVRFLGDKDGSSAAPDHGLQERAAGMTTEERRTYFGLRNPLDRAFVIFAGPALNFVLGLAIIASLYVFNGRAVTEPVIGEVQISSPAAEAGLLAGDRIVRLDGMDITQFQQVQERITLLPSTEVTFEVERGVDGAAETRVFKVMTASERIEILGTEQTIGRIGIVSAGETTIVPVGPLPALYFGLTDIVRVTQSTFVGIGQIFTGVRPVDELGGPVKIAEISGNAAQIGWTAFIFLAAGISINLAIMNLLPLPVLDGGHLVFCLVEAVTRRPISEKVLKYSQVAGAAVLLSFMCFVTFNDVISLFR